MVLEFQGHRLELRQQQYRVDSRMPSYNVHSLMPFVYLLPCLNHFVSTCLKAYAYGATILTVGTKQCCEQIEQNFCLFCDILGYNSRKRCRK